MTTFEPDEKFLIENILARLVRTTPYIYTNSDSSSLSFSKLVEWRLKKNNSFENKKVSWNDPLHISTWVELRDEGKAAVDKVFSTFGIDAFNPDNAAQICYVHRLVSHLKKLKWNTGEIDIKSACSLGDANLRYKYLGTDEDDLAKMPFLFDTRTTLTEIVQEEHSRSERDALAAYRADDVGVFYVPKKGQLSGCKLHIPTEEAHRILTDTKTSIMISLVLSMDLLNTQEIIKKLNKKEQSYKDGYLIRIKNRTIRIYPYFECSYCTIVSSRLNFFIPF